MRCFSGLSVFCIVFLFGSAGCKPFFASEVSPADSLQVNAGNGAALRGDITGFVTLCDEFGTVKPKSDSMIVSLEGLQTAFPVRTRPEGRFVIINAFAGKYNLSYNKKGYGNFKRIGITHAGGPSPTIVEPVVLWETAQTVVNELAVQVSGLTLTFSGLTAPVQPAGADTTQVRRVRLFLGRDEHVTQLNYVSSPNPIAVPPGGTGAFTLKLPADDLLAFKPGERVYVVAHGITAIENAYVDPDTKQKIYTGINPKPSNVVNFVLP